MQYGSFVFLRYEKGAICRELNLKLASWPQPEPQYSNVIKKCKLVAIPFGNGSKVVFSSNATT